MIKMINDIEDNGDKILKNLASVYSKISPEVLKKSAGGFDFFRHRKSLERTKKIAFKGYRPHIRWLLLEKNYTDIRNGVYDEWNETTDRKSIDDKTEEAYERLLKAGQIQ